jgi:8-oxo-dGTP pyrophosphatase MutT (NUDIX family)
MAEILTPRPAATVLTLRDAPNGYEILMLRRNIRSDFMGGAYVFPGGGVDELDARTDRLIGLNDESASRRLGLASGGLAYYVACLRELFEEAGLLIACTQDGERVNFTDPKDLKRMAALRRSVNAGDMGFVAMMEQENLLLDLRGIEYLAHWITPEGAPRRYDTRFFVALAPGGQVATHDEGETVANEWLRPVDALAARERGDLEIMFPTVRNMEPIQHFSTAREVLNYAQALQDIPCIEPRVVRGSQMKILMPGDEGFDDAGA